jgi:hypothetical protein
MSKRTRNGDNKGCCVRAEKRLAIYLRDSFMCQYCGKDLHREKPFNVTLDHLRPQVKSGNNEPKNLVTACRACNCGRQDKPWRKYATSGAIQRIQRTVKRVLPRDLAKSIIKGEVHDPRK